MCDWMRGVLAGAILGAVFALSAKHEPNPVAIDYTPRFDAIDAQLKKLTERSLLKPACTKCHAK